MGDPADGPPPGQGARHPCGDLINALAREVAKAWSGEQSHEEGLRRIEQILSGEFRLEPPEAPTPDSLAPFRTASTGPGQTGFVFVVRIDADLYQSREMDLANDMAAIEAAPTVLQAVIDHRPPAARSIETAGVKVGRGCLSDGPGVRWLGEWTWAQEDDEWTWTAEEVL